jgi:phosphate transport system protein
MASRNLHRALDAFARTDTIAAAQIVLEDEAIDNQFRAFMRKLSTYMVEDAQTIPSLSRTVRTACVLSPMRD